MRKQRSKDRLETLREVPLFAGMTDAALQAVDRLADDAFIDSGAELAREGTPGAAAYVIVSGTAEVLVGDRRVNDLGPGDLVGEMALLDNVPQCATVRATSAVHALVLTRRGLNEMLRLEPLSVRAIRAMSKRLRGAQSESEALQTK